MERSTGNIDKKDIFKGKLDVSRNLFCNYLQKHYIESSKQSLEAPVRPLAIHEFSFLFSKKLSKNFDDPSTIITQKDFDNFWTWFGPTLQKIRYQKFLHPMWNQGLAFGIIDKSEAEKQLRDFGAGTFLLRFSERQTGSLAIAYKQSRAVCRHYIIKNTDTTGQGKSLPNFIRDSPSLLQFLRCSISDIGGERKISTIDKYLALQKIGSNKNKKSEDQGMLYDDELQDLDIGSLSLRN